jgi:hypothetical protein
MNLVFPFGFWFFEIGIFEKKGVMDKIVGIF